MRSYGPGRKVVLATGLLACGSALAQAQTTPSPSIPGQAIPGTLGVSPFSASTPARIAPGVVPPERFDPGPDYDVSDPAPAD